MALTAKNRKKVEELIYSTLMKLEPSGMNAEKYKKIFAKMSDKEFVAYFTKLKESDTAHLYVETDLYGKNQITMRSIRKAAKHINVPLEEYVYTRHKLADGTVTRTAYKVPVFYIHMKRMQQFLSKKNRTNVDIDGPGVRARLTGSLNSAARTGRFTDMDTQVLISATSETGRKVDRDGPLKGEVVSPIVMELLQMRGDNVTARNFFNREISVDGSASLLATGSKIALAGKASEAGQAVNSLEMFFIGAGMRMQRRTGDTTYLNKGGASVD